VQAMITEQKERKTANGVEKIITERMVRGRVVSVDERSGKFTIAEGNTQHTDVFPDKVQHIQEPNRLKWSHDGKYLARLGPDVISVYELPSMALLDKKSIAAKDVLDFVWSPKSNMISYWSPAVGNHPSLINIIKVPERTDICSRKIFDVTDGRMVWQNEGDYLCVFMCKITGKKKTFVLMFFRMNEPGVPVEQIELAEPILNVSWEPSGDRLSIVHGEARTPTVSFYSMNGAPAQPAPGGKAGSKTPVKKELTLLFQLKDVQVNDVLWSPAGDVVALAFYAPDTCMFQLYDVENNTMLANRRHDRGNRLAWDPSGRVLASCTINPLKERQVRGHADDGFILYSFQGAVLSQLRREKLYQFQWRPRPKDLMTADERRKVVKNLRKYEKMFEKEDKQRKQELNAELLAARHAQAADFYQIISRNRANNKSLKPRRIDLRRGYDEDDDRNYIFETRIEEIVLSTKEQIIQ
jgi:translation initiation factor 3 subunit B